MLRLSRISIALSLLITVSACCSAKPDRDVLFQTSTIDALMAGIYDGQVTMKQLEEQGDFGLGTFDALDGEMIGLDGKFYQITSDGMCHPVGDSMLTPFAAVTFFDRDKTGTIDREMDLAGLEGYLDDMLPSKNMFYAVRLDGTFYSMKTRSVPKQTKPYPKLVDVVAKQPTFEFADVKGTIIGFWCPYFAKSVNVPGYHLHFINAERTRGGHVLDCRIKGGSAALDITPKFSLSLPQSYEFRQTDFSGTSQDLKTVEQGK